MAEPTLVIGLGNLLMGDDSVGLVALERLRTDWELPDDIELMDGGTWGMNLLPFIEASDRVILLDAIQNNTAPGTLIELSGDQVPRALSHKLSPHQIDMREVLAVASLRGTLPRDLLAIGIEPFDTEMSTELSDVVAAAVPRLVTRAVQRLKSYGHPCVRHVSSAVCTS